jgi:tetratricopeptide (TPR) repeat protein
MTRSAIWGVMLLLGAMAAGCAHGPRKYSHYDMAMNLKAESKVDDAIVELQASIQADPDDPTVHNALAEIYYAKGMRDQAVAEWEKALATGSTDPAFYQKSDVKRSVEWIGDGVKAYQAATVEIVKAYMEQASDDFDKGLVAEAAVIWAKVVVIKKDDLDAWKLLGKAHKKLKNIPAAYEAYKQASQLAPKEWQMQKEYGYAAFAMDKLSEAEDAFQKWVDLDPTNPLSYNNLGAVLAKLQRYDEAYAAYDKALEKQPDMLAALNGKATAYYYQKNYEEARQIWGHVLEIAPDDPTAKENIRTLVKMGY